MLLCWMGSQNYNLAFDKTDSFRSAEIEVTCWNTKMQILAESFIALWELFACKSKVHSLINSALQGKQVSINCPLPMPWILAVPWSDTL